MAMLNNQRVNCHQHKKGDLSLTNVICKKDNWGYHQHSCINTHGDNWVAKSIPMFHHVQRYPYNLVPPSYKLFLFTPISKNNPHYISISIHLPFNPNNQSSEPTNCQFFIPSTWTNELVNGNFRILKWRYVSTICLTIFRWDIPLGP
jgi:hypothetical protein